MAVLKIDFYTQSYILAPYIYYIPHFEHKKRLEYAKDKKTGTQSA